MKIKLEITLNKDGYFIVSTKEPFHQVIDADLGLAMQVLGDRLSNSVSFDEAPPIDEEEYKKRLEIIREQIKNHQAWKL